MYVREITFGDSYKWIATEKNLTGMVPLSVHYCIPINKNWQPVVFVGAYVSAITNPTLNLEANFLGLNKNL